MSRYHTEMQYESMNKKIDDSSLMCNQSYSLANAKAKHTECYTFYSRKLTEFQKKTKTKNLMLTQNHPENELICDKQLNKMY